LKPLTKSEIARTLKALEKTNGNRAAAGRLIGLKPTAMGARVSALKAAGHRITEPAGNSTVGRGKDETKELRTRLALAEKALGVERAKTKARRPQASTVSKRDFTIVIRPDLHGAYQDRDAVAGYLAAVRDIRPDMVIGVGDLIDAGSFLAAHHVLGYVADGDYSVDDDVAAASAFLDAEQEASNGCKHVEIEGNHDHRLEQWCLTQAQRNSSGDVKKMASWLMSKFGPDALFGFKQRGFDYVRRGDIRDDLEPGTYRFRECLYTHGNFTGVDCCARALNAYGTNIVFGHTHRSLGYVRRMGNRPIGAWTMGCLSQLRRFWNHGRPTDWTHGFAIQTWSGDVFQHNNVVIHKGKALYHGVGIGTKK